MYSKLPTPRSTRVLSFLQSDDENVLHCEWAVISVDEGKPYWALSYVWGDPSSSQKEMMCNGNPTKITYNLYCALRAIWKVQPGVDVWADAICINQDDIPERNQQVSMMGSIYQNAAMVAVWVGDATQKSDDFFAACQIVANEEGDQLSLENSPCPSDEEGINDQQKRLSYLLDCSQDVAYRPWFIRAWTLQEIQLSARALFLCGSNIIGFGLFLKTVTAINKISQQQDFCGSRSINTRMLARISNDKSLYRLIALTQPRQSTDPRDKIYSLLSLLPDGLYDFMQPDYSLSYEEVFTYACRVCIEVDNEMNILVGAGLGADQNSFKRSDKLPSWVVDFRVVHGDISYWQNLSRTISASNEEARCSRRQQGQALHPKDTSILIKGTVFGRINIDANRRLVAVQSFPPCALKSFHQECTEKGRHVNIPAEEFIAFCGRMRVHDSKACSCGRSAWMKLIPSCIPIPSAPRTEPYSLYKLQDMPRELATGDWLWTTAIQNGSERGSEDVNSSQKKDEIHHFFYGIRPVDKGRFRLVGKTNGLDEVDAEGERYYSDWRANKVAVQTSVTFI
ncbi:hypothetical protein ONZ45_g3521 [Pleurotus djamor]|nr:hypothetical protein ONZ45_g3521 [Pleurotus djamor]